MTSKERNGRSDRLRISQERPARLHYRNSDGTTELYLENGTMNKQSYVVLEHIFQIPALQLRSCSFRSGSCAYDSRLCEQSYTLLMGRFGLEPEHWVRTMLLPFSTANSPKTLRRQYQPRTFGNRNVLATQPLAQYQPVAATNLVFSSPYRYTEQSPLLTNNAPSRVPGLYRQQSLSRVLHSDTYSKYRRFGQRKPVPPPEHISEHSISFGLIVVLAVVSIVLAVIFIFWWFWPSK